MNMRVTRAEVIKTASDMADRNGLHNVSLKAIASHLFTDHCLTALGALQLLLNLLDVLFKG